MITSAIPDVLHSVIDILRSEPRLEICGSWVLNKNEKWSLKLQACLSVPATVYMPEVSTWHLVVSSGTSGETVQFFPDITDGITATFEHQDHNAISSEICSWRTGKPCLEKALAAFGRSSWSGEPEAFLDKVVWFLQRLLAWIDAAANDELAMKDDPLELPAFSGQSLFPLIGFKEDAGELSFWMNYSGKWGYASTYQLRGALSTRFISRFYDKSGRPLKIMDWAPSMPRRSKEKDSLWIVLPSLPIIPPWQAPSSWNELRTSLDSWGIDLQSILVQAGINTRSAVKIEIPARIMLGFPLAERVGNKANRMHWLVISLPPLSHKTSYRKGFRATEHNHRLWDAEIAFSDNPLRWIRTANWATDQLRTRGAAEDIACCKRIMIIGAGSLGGTVAENLIRMGICNLNIVDSDRLVMGNLSRHVLDMGFIGYSKAAALACQLNRTLPDAKVRALSGDFPAESEHVKDAYRACEIIVDCTGDDNVLRALSSFDWKSEKLFISLAMTWRAEGLFAYAASESSFPAIDAMAHFSRSPSPDIIENEARPEGIGCWHPVFPASADDVQLWGAIATKFIRRVILNPGRHYEYYRQMSDGTVEREQ
ncbi:ThiF family adenylyltransferase [Pluralibacter gergoviae]|uniref:ThiF family adenylyltransferase n=1 Tax=Pluralibacter gergoviae TaxID=61647 RepID=UPI002910A034|nr:ThiF family adenylyltransferase [Pluralibacter gergoviae]MDU4003200.1 ThiF family adenylyltransferase [Pluralibacter gergoviae]